MDQNIYSFLRSQGKYLNFVRNNPEWYRYLARDPKRWQEIPQEAKVYYGQTFSQRLERMNQQIQMLGLLGTFIKGKKE